MPNIWVSTKYNKFKMYEMGKAREIDAQDTSVEWSRDYLTLKVPLKVLGDPQFLLSCVVTTKTFLSLESMGFRRISIEK